MTNKAVREFTKKRFPKNPGLAKKLGVKVKMEIHLDPDHQAFILFEAPSAEAVRDYLVQGGYLHFSRLSFHLVTPIADLLRQVDSMPTIY
jgi:hypothetical protein